MEGHDPFHEPFVAPVDAPASGADTGAAAAEGDAVEHLWNAAHELLRALRSVLDAADEFVGSQRGARPPARDGAGAQGAREGRVHRIDIDLRSDGGAFEDAFDGAFDGTSDGADAPGDSGAGSGIGTGTGTGTGAI